MKQILCLFFLFLYFKSTAQDLDNEANLKLDSIKNSLTNYNNDPFALTFKEYQYSSYKQWTLYQFKNLKVNLTKENVSLVEKLNGIEWKGTVKISADAIRSIFWTTGYDIYGGNSSKEKSIWSEWSAFENWIIIFTKKRGTWRIWTKTYFRSDAIPNRKPTHDEIKDLYNHEMADNSYF